MLDPAIQDFLEMRKELWLKKKIKARSSEEEKIEFKQEANALFKLSTWLPNAAKRAKQLSLVSHPSKFTHPSAKTSAIIALKNYAADGYLRTGNVAVELDVFGAAAMDVYKFLIITLSDGQNILQHLEQQTDIIAKQFTLSGSDISYDDIAVGLLAIKHTEATQTQTSERIKQVYFPIDDKENHYHLLSILTPSGIMYKLKERLNIMRFSEKTKQARAAKKKAVAHDEGYSDIYGLAAIGFGGTKPQNISVLNSKNGGVANLLSSMPPILDKKHISSPKSDFFSCSVHTYFLKKDFQLLHKQLSNDTKNIHIKREIQWLIKHIIYQVVDQSWKIRSLDAGWSLAERCQSLPHYQKIWLDQNYQIERSSDTKWLDKVKLEIARWFIQSYKKLLGDGVIHWDDTHLLQLKNIISDCEEALK